MTRLFLHILVRLVFVFLLFSHKGFARQASETIIIDSYLFKTYEIRRKPIVLSVSNTNSILLKSNLKLPSNQKDFDLFLHCSDHEQNLKFKDSMTLQLPHSFDHCMMTITHHKTSRSVQIQILKELPFRLLPLLTSKANQSESDFKPLKTRTEGFNAKVKALLGRSLTDAEIQSQNPWLSLTSDHIPKLDAIWISTLVYKHDFYGTIISRLLKLHVDRGTRIRLYVTESLLNKKNREKDRAQLRDLELYSPRIKVYRYRFKTNNPVSIDPLHRSLHAKLFITQSQAQPELNTLIFGGRNIADEFLFLSKPDYSQHPELLQYSKGEDRFVPFEDMEYQCHACDRDSVFIKHLELLGQDIFSPYLKNNSLAPMVPYFSIPFEDHQALRDLYVAAIDRAQASIRIVSPYFYPENQIQDALYRAIKRGVKIELISQMTLTGDDFPKIAENVNKAALNRYQDKIKLYSWNIPGMIIHSKILLIDQTEAFIGSVNFDNRSFAHDIEAGFILHDPKSLQDISDLIDSYHEHVDPIEVRFSIFALHKIWIKLLHDYF